MCPEILAFGSHCSVNFQPILDSFIPNLKLKHEDSEDIGTDPANTAVFNEIFGDSQYLYRFQRTLLGTPSIYTGN